MFIHYKVLTISDLIMFSDELKVFPFLRFRMNLKYFYFAFLDELKVFLKIL